jgi:hypothetical protein
MSDECIAVFTVESPHRILHQGGSRAWALASNRARKCCYLVCVQNLYHPDRDFSEASEPHGAVFLVGKISDVIPDSTLGDRWRICISEYALHTVMNAWKGWRNPVRYTTLREMGIDLEALTFRSVSDGQRDLSITAGQQAPTVATKKQDDEPIAPLSIAQAKAGLAAYYGISQEAIEIVIRG